MFCNVIPDLAGEGHVVASGLPGHMPVLRRDHFLWSLIPVLLPLGDNLGLSLAGLEP